MNLGWMVWTVPTAIFFVVIAFMLAGMTVWQIVAPSPERGFRRSDDTGRSLFVGLTVSAYWHLRIGWRFSLGRACRVPDLVAAVMLLG
jgi:predicted small integral membrane protein